MTTCDQGVYDHIYERIIQIALHSEQSEADIKEKNDAIENLRKLCNGQRSSYETGDKLRKPEMVHKQHIQSR